MTPDPWTQALLPSFRPAVQRRQASQEILPFGGQAIALLIQGDDARFTQLSQALIEDRWGQIAALFSQGPETKGALTHLPKDSEGPSAAHQVEQGHDRSAASGSPCRLAGLGRPFFHENPLRYNFCSDTIGYR